MINQFNGTSLPQTNDPTEIKKSVLDLLDKTNQVWASEQNDLSSLKSVLLAFPSIYVSGIISGGTNSNGTYIKFADGTMICWRYIGSSSYTMNATALAAGIYTHEFGVSGNIWPASFISNPFATYNAAEATGDLSVNWAYNIGPATYYFGGSLINTNSSSYSATWNDQCIFAVGRWK